MKIRDLFRSIDPESDILIFDTDLGTDDAAAIMLLAKKCRILPDYMIASGGNTSPSQAIKNAIILKKYFGLDKITVVKGLIPECIKNGEQNTFHGSDGLAGISEDMADILRLTDENYSDFITFDDFQERLTSAREITYISVGPVTSLAALLCRKHVRKKIKKAYVMGGGINESNCEHSTEFNFSKDPESVKKIFASGTDITLFPLDLTNHQNLTEEQIDALEKTGAYPEYIKLFRFNLESNTKYDGIDKAVLHDCMPVLYYLDPSPFKTEDMPVITDELGATKISADGVSIHIAIEAPDDLLFSEFNSIFNGGKNA